jgi:hypothetical protein
MTKTIAVWSAVLFLLLGATAASAAGTNASWNAGPNEKGTLGFAIYDKEGTCEEFRKALPLRIGMKKVKAGESSGPVQRKDLDFCLLFVSDKADSPNSTTNCASGTIEFAFDEKANEYRGKYDLKMKNKMVRRGEFRAQLCKAPVPAKK